MNGVNKTLHDLNVKEDPKKILYDSWISFMCMKNFLLLFYQEIPYEDIDKILQMLNSAKQTSNNPIWNQWILATNYSINETYPLDQPLTK
jgi:hypothetical protein